MVSLPRFVSDKDLVLYTRNMLSFTPRFTVLQVNNGAPAQVAQEAANEDAAPLSARRRRNHFSKKNLLFLSPFYKALLPGSLGEQRRERVGGALSACLCTSQDDDTRALSLTLSPLLSN